MASDPLEALVGPIPPGALVQVWGPSGVGKTSLVLSCLRAGDCLVDGEGLLPGRLAAVTGPVRRELLVGRAADHTGTLRFLANAARLLEQGRRPRVFVDGALHHWRFERCADRAALAETLAGLHALRGAARRSGGHVVLTNQATAGPTGVPRPLGGAGLLHLCDIIVALCAAEPPWVEAVLEKHPMAAAGRHVDARIVDGRFVVEAGLSRRAREDLSHPVHQT